ncbi:MAG: secretin N-terminal domain-containing protein [Candidatus Kaelpia aquatica]|nr:secretin N-terminal domain-containing protein [Candidatus Kaelpia aquatica]
MIRNTICFLSLLSLLIPPFILNVQAAPGLMDDEGVSDKLTKNIKIEQKADNLYNIEFRNADIKDIIRYFAREYGLNIIADKDVEGVVTASLGNITIKQALGQILDSQNYTMIEIDNVIRVKAKPSLVKTFKLHNVSAQDVSENTTSLLGSEGKIVIDEATNSIMVTDSLDNLNMIKSFIENVDVKGRQVLIEAKFVETTLDTSKNLGIEWGTTVTVRGAARPHTFPFNVVDPKFALGNEDAQIGTAAASRTNLAGFPAADSDLYTFGTLDFTQFKAVLQALLTDGNTKVISNPQVATLNNKLATMGVTTEYPLPTYEVSTDTGELTVSGYEYKDIGITLNVTPFIASDDYITMTIEPTVGTVGATISVGDTGFELPIISSKTATTKVTIKNGETIVIGGLISTEKVKSMTKVPLLGSIPLLGKLFSYEGESESSSELLIFVTPHILNLEGEEEIQKKRIDELYSDIGKLMLDDDYESIILKANEILEIDEEEERAKDLRIKAEEKIKQKEIEEAEKVKERDIYLMSLWREANSFYAEGEYQQAKDRYARILAEDPRDGMAVDMLKKSEEKIELLSERVPALLLRAKKSFKEREYHQALEDYYDVLQLDPDNKEAKKSVEDIYESIRSLEEEEKIKDDLVKAKALYDEEKFQKAKIVLDELLELDSDNKEIQNYVTLTAGAIKQEQDLKNIWEEANSLYADKEYESAQIKYNDILTIDSNNKSARQMVERCQNGIQRYNRKEVAELLSAGKKYLIRGENQEALDCFTKVLELDSTNKKAEKNISKIKDVLRSKEVQPYKAKIEKEPDSLYTSGVKSYNEANYNEAIHLFEKVLMADPTHENAYRYLEMAYKRKGIAGSEAVVETELKTTVGEDALGEKILTEKEIRGLYQEAVRLYKDKEYDKALDKFGFLSQLDSKYQKISKKKMESCLEKIREPILLSKVEEKYQLGLDYFKKDIYGKSIQFFLEVLDLKPNYKDANKYLKLSRDRLQMMDSLGDFEQDSIEDK